MEIKDIIDCVIPEREEEFAIGARIGTFYGFVFGLLFACFEVWILVTYF